MVTDRHIPAQSGKRAAQSFGTLRRVDLRELWPHEAHDFTPWLADNLSILGDLLGMELELVARESPVGPFSLDLLLHDVGTDRIVAVENQIEPTDHDHLGKLLTYAAGNEAAVAIWIAPSFRDEHRQTLDWLNANTDSDVEFFGIVLEVLRIDDSRPAPHLRLVSFPNDFRRRTIAERKQTSELSETYRVFFQELIDRLRTEYRFTQATKGQPQSWYSFASGFSNLSYAVVFGQNQTVRVELYIDRSSQAWNKALFDTLQEDADRFATKLDDELEWQRLDERRASRIFVSRSGSVRDDPETLQETMNWAIDRLRAMKAVFGPRLPAAIERADTIVADMTNEVNPA